MAIPLKVTGAGNNSTAQNVYRVTFSTALSSAPKIEAWDNSSTFPARDASGSTVTKEIFVGTTGNGSKPMLSAVATTSVAPSSAWKPASATAGSANPNRLKGTTNYVTDPTTPGAGGNIRFNACVEVPYDASVPSSSSMNAMIQIRYTYTGTAPTITWDANEGTETTPTWTTATPGTHGIRYCNAAATVSDSNSWKLTLPDSSTVDDGAQLVTA